MRDTRTELHWGRVMRCYVQRPRTLDAMFGTAVADHPEAEALVDGSTRLAYRELDRRVDRLAAGLATRGVAQGDRVAMMLANRLEAVIGVLAVARLGAAVVLIGTRLRRPEIEYIVGDSQASALIYESVLEGELPSREQAPASEMRFCVDSAAFEALFADQPPPAAVIGEEDLFGILYTSGTTGKPKGAMLTHLGVVHSALHWVECLGLGHGERTLLCIPWAHVAGLCGVVLPFLQNGGRLVLMRDFNRGAFLELAAKERITHALLVPAMYGLLLLEPDLSSFDFSCWRLGVYGSAPMPEATIRRFAEAVPGLVMCNAYGATETTSPATIMPGTGPRRECAGGSAQPDRGRAAPAGSLLEHRSHSRCSAPFLLGHRRREPAILRPRIRQVDALGLEPRAGLLPVHDRQHRRRTEAPRHPVDLQRRGLALAQADSASRSLHHQSEADRRRRESGCECATLHRADGRIALLQPGWRARVPRQRQHRAHPSGTRQRRPQVPAARSAQLQRAGAHGNQRRHRRGGSPGLGRSLLGRRERRRRRPTRGEGAAQHHRHDLLVFGRRSHVPGARAGTSLSQAPSGGRISQSENGGAGQRGARSCRAGDGARGGHARGLRRRHAARVVAGGT